MGLSLYGANLWNNRMPSSMPNCSNPTNATQNQGLTPQQRQEQAKISQIQAQYKGACNPVNFEGNPNQKAADVLSTVRSRRESEIRGHEQAHQSAAGSLGGGIHMQYDQNGVAFAGHVPITLPGLNKNNPEVSMKVYQTVRFAALAPEKPSGQDVSVASKAQSLMGQAQVLINQKKQQGAHNQNPGLPANARQNPVEPMA